MDPQRIRILGIARDLVFNYNDDEAFRQHINNTYIRNIRRQYRGRKFIDYISALITFSPKYGNYYRVSGRTIVDKIPIFLKKCFDDKQEFNKLRLVLTNQTAYTPYRPQPILPPQTHISFPTRAPSRGGGRYTPITKEGEKAAEKIQIPEAEKVLAAQLLEKRIKLFKDQLSDDILRAKLIKNDIFTEDEVKAIVEAGLLKINRTDNPEKWQELLNQTAEQILIEQKKKEAATKITPTPFKPQIYKEREERRSEEGIVDFPQEQIYVEEPLYEGETPSMKEAQRELSPQKSQSSIPNMRYPRMSIPNFRYPGGSGPSLARVAMAVPQVRIAVIAVVGAIALFILILTFLNLLESSALLPPFKQEIAQAAPIGGGFCPDQATIDQNTRDPNTCRYFGLGVDIFDTNFSETQIQSYLNTYREVALTRSGRSAEVFERLTRRIVERSQKAGLNPIIALGYWRTESALGERFGCLGGVPLGFEAQLNCVLGGNPDLPINPSSIEQGSIGPRCAREGKLGHTDWAACRTIASIRQTHATIYSSIPISLPIRTFDDLVEVHGSRAPQLEVYNCRQRGDIGCDNLVNRNCSHTYNQLVEVAQVTNSCRASIPGVVSTVGTVTCPLSQSGEGSFRIICGTAKNIINNCGHGAPLPYYPTCTAPPYQTCPYSPQLQAAVDVRPPVGIGNNAPVYLPFINGEAVSWSRESSVDLIRGWGSKIEFRANHDGKNYRLDLTHVTSINLTAARSGDQVALTQPGLDRDGGSHLHVAISVDGRWLDAVDERICTSR